MDSFFDPPGGQGYVKAGFLGFTAGGKTFTAIELAIGIREHFGLEGPIAFFDTENGATFVRPRVREATGKDLLVKRSKSFDDLMAFAAACEQQGVAVAMVDSLTHVWRELCDAYLRKVNEREANWAARHGRQPQVRMNLQFEDWNPIKQAWARWTDWYLNSAMHVVICGRAGWEYEEERDEKTGKKKLVKIGTKMKVEGEFGFEPGLLVEMERIMERNEDGAERLVNRATILKDRWNVINGFSCDNPTFGFFKPHVLSFTPGDHHGVDSTVKSDVPIENHGTDNYSRELTARKIACEEIQAELVRRWPGQTTEAKAQKAEKLEELFGTRSWTAVENMSSRILGVGLAKLKE